MTKKGPKAHFLIPEEIVFEVLKELPFRCVSHHWQSTIDDPSFIAAHRTRSHTRPGGTTILARTHDSQFFSLNPEGGSPPLPLKTPPFTFPCDPFPFYFQSVHGLLCFGNTVWNPSTRQTLSLPWDYNRSALQGFDSRHPSMEKCGCSPLEFQRICYWKSLLRKLNDLYMMENKELEIMILAFDVEQEKFRLISFPYHANRWPCLVQIGECLSAMDGYPKKLWLLDDKGEWIRASFIIPGLSTYVERFFGSIHTGEILLQGRPQSREDELSHELIHAHYLRLRGREVASILDFFAAAAAISDRAVLCSPSPGCAAKYVALQVAVTPSLLPCVHNWRDHYHLSRVKETRFGDVAPVVVHRLCLSPLSFFMDILQWLHLLVSGQTSARIPKHLLALLFHCGSFKYIHQVLLRLLLRASVQRLLLSSIHLANTTGPMSDSSSPVWTFSLSRYSLPVFLLLQLLLFPLETLSIPPLASKLYRFDSCISMKHALPRSPSWISCLPCGTGLSFANNCIVSHPYKSLACYMCREHLSVSAQVVSNS
ncbi:hypothetical protein Acr_04g0004490 [Actinidia rufa]|uniref:F-box domain-containing protein n=1 Tax=Actinidia rufa TaxID=165716 RepID=A0A7J0EGX9_9ERIC|nr:hypothetical protein Acr_04g0004490 [Actinidia rufa]